MVVDLNREPPVNNFRNPSISRVTVQVEVRNHGDTVLANRGLLAPDKVRKMTVSGVVDTGATQLVLPASAAEQLGLTEIGQAYVRFAENRRESRAVVEDAEIHLLGRNGTFNAVIEPSREDALIGAVVLETLDFIVDCGKQTLIPRDPHRILAEIE